MIILLRTRCLSADHDKWFYTDHIVKKTLQSTHGEPTGVYCYTKYWQVECGGRAPGQRMYRAKSAKPFEAKSNLFYNWYVLVSWPLC